MPVSVVFLLLCLLLTLPGGGAGDVDKASIARQTFASSRVVHAQQEYVDCHFGVGVATDTLPSDIFSVLHSGWYLDWRTQTSPLAPAGVEYVQVLRTRDSGYVPSGSDLEAVIAANPGALWLVGNEPDCIWQDNVLPQNYARVYHDAYTFIKQADLTARVAVGGVVQPTLVRMQYLDIVLETYRALYGGPLPTDAWNVHSFILREASCAAYPDCWGAEISPGVEASAGELYELDDTDDLGIFASRLIAFRRWMRDRGYRDTPLFISEYGTLLPYYDPDKLYYDSDEEPFDEERARSFVVATFDYLRTAQDAELGYPADENRLVQRWLWYSLDDSIYYGGALYDGATMQIRQLGQDLAAYTGSLEPAIDLVAVDVGQLGAPPLSPAQPVTLTLQARISNVGNVPTTGPAIVRFYDGAGQQIGADQVVQAGLAGCAETAWVEVEWPSVPPGSHQVRVEVDPDGALTEASEANNQREGIVLVASERLYLPRIGHR